MTLITELSVNSKLCNTCKQYKDLNKFHKHPMTKDKVTTQCGDCRNIKNRIYNKVGGKTNRDFWTEKEIKILFDGINNGIKITKISKILNRKPAAVYRKLKRLKIKTHFLQNKTTVDEIRQLIQSGLIITEVAKQLNCSPQTVTKFCRNYGYNPTDDYTNIHNIKKYKILSEGISGFNKVFSAYRRGAHSRNLEFNLNKDLFYKLTQQSCFYCGEVPKSISKPGVSKSLFIYNGIDRMDSDIGYIETNVVTSCKQCNRMKWDYNQLEFIEKCKIIAERFK